MKKILHTAAASAVQGNRWAKLTSHSVLPWEAPSSPKSDTEQLQLDVRYSYARETPMDDGTAYHTFKTPPNAGNVPGTIKGDENGGTHAVVAGCM
jgi:hypothetical protein